MIKELVKLSNHLDAKGLRKEADYLDAVIKKAKPEIDLPEVTEPDVSGLGDQIAALGDSIKSNIDSMPIPSYAKKALHLYFDTSGNQFDSLMSMIDLHQRAGHSPAMGGVPLPVDVNVDAYEMPEEKWESLGPSNWHK